MMDGRMDGKNQESMKMLKLLSYLAIGKRPLLLGFWSGFLFHPSHCSFSVPMPNGFMRQTAEIGPTLGEVCSGKQMSPWNSEETHKRKSRRRCSMDSNTEWMSCDENPNRPLMKRLQAKSLEFRCRDLNPGLSGESRVSWPTRLQRNCYVKSPLC